MLFTNLVTLNEHRKANVENVFAKPLKYVDGSVFPQGCWSWLFLAHAPKYDCQFLIYWAFFFPVDVVVQPFAN